MKNYYKILEVSENATPAEIKRSYRVLAKKYHPDRSGFSNATHLFAEINEAYQVLSEPDQKLQYDRKRNGANYHTGQRQYTYKRQRPRPKHAAYRTSKEQVDIRPYVPYFKKISYIGFVLSVLLSVDFFLPRHIEQETVTNINRVMSMRNGQMYLVAVQVTTAHRAFRVGLNEWLPISRGDTISVKSSQIFDYTTSIVFSEESLTKTLTIKTSIYANFSFSLIVLLITSGIGSFLIKSPMSVLNFGIVNGILLLIVSYFMSIS